MVQFETTFCLAARQPALACSHAHANTFIHALVVAQVAQELVGLFGMMHGFLSVLMCSLLHKSWLGCLV